MFRCTSLYGTPTMLIDMLNQEDLSNFDLTSIRTGTVRSISKILKGNHAVIIVFF